MIPHLLARFLAAVAMLLLAAASTRAQDGQVLIPLPAGSDGVVVTEISIEARGSTGDPGRDSELKGEARRLVAIAPGESFDIALADGTALRLRRLPGVRNATWELRRGVNPDRVVLLLRLDLAPGRRGPEPEGLVATGSGFPLLWRSDTAMLTLTLNGGVGAYSDRNPWFRQAPVFTRGNPLVRNPGLGAGTGASTSWAENATEAGLAGAVQLGGSAFYAYGALSWIAVSSAGRDIFRDDTRATFNIEKGYAGLLYVAPDGSFKGSLSAGRQTFTLNDGFLISQFGSQSNAGPRPGVYLAPRTTLDNAVLAKAAWGRWTLQGFYLDPNEYEPLESNTRVLGANLRYTVTPSFYGDATVYTVPRSETKYVLTDGRAGTREGLTTFAGHLRWADASVLRGLWLESEAAHQTSSTLPMNAWAGYGTVGYLASGLPWTPSLSYRLSVFTGDDPRTRTFERFDPLYSGGLAEWLQGISTAKALPPANRVSHRLRANVSPFAGLDLTVDWFVHRADRLNNRGANPALAQLRSEDLGQEAQATVRWALNRNLYVLAVAAHAVPGRAIKLAMPDGAAKPWSTLQAQLFWSF
ncbi:hypothetical protein SLNSH_15885 [Alsobacter soli]|uniref:Alginate export domain-containing protein n=1 Tax=Alsobacter soli TaxID=2109933 RepID=A0A2T1HR01_9HYPH|nr:alginate export family protein [Alsobacter soli]PSC04084.1 hypothetical protein SLNSH_15885 [Alsobacter soli]